LLNAEPRRIDHEKAAPATAHASPIGTAAKFRRVSPTWPWRAEIDGSSPFGVIDLTEPCALSMLVQVREATPAGVHPRALESFLSLGPDGQGDNAGAPALRGRPG
jgi:hypothetical protein